MSFNDEAEEICLWVAGPIPPELTPDLTRLLVELRSVPEGADLGGSKNYTKRGSGVRMNTKLCDLLFLGCFPLDMSVGELKNIISCVKTNVGSKYNTKAYLTAFLKGLQSKIHRRYSIMGRSGLATVPVDVPVQSHAALKSVRMDPEERVQLPGSHKNLLVRSVAYAMSNKDTRAALWVKKRRSRSSTARANKKSKKSKFPRSSSYVVCVGCMSLDARLAEGAANAIDLTKE